MIQMNLQHGKRLTDLKNKLTVGSGEGTVRGFGKVMYALLYSKGITDRELCVAYGALLHVTWQAGWEGGAGRTDPCVCVAESLCCSLEMTTALTDYTPIQNKKFEV